MTFDTYPTNLTLTGNERKAVLHLMRSAFGSRLQEVAHVTDVDDLLTVRIPNHARPMMSSGERLLLDVVESLAQYGPSIDLHELAARLDDQHFDRLIGALLILRGRDLKAMTA